METGGCRSQESRQKDLIDLAEDSIAQSIYSRGQFCFNSTRLGANSNIWKSSSAFELVSA